MLKTMKNVIYFKDSLMNINLKRTAYIEIEILQNKCLYCHLIHVMLLYRVKL